MLTVDRYRALAAAGVGEFVVSRYDAQDSAAVVTLKRYRAEHKDKVRVIYKTLERITTRGGLIKVEKDIIKKKTCFYPSWNIIIDYKGDVIFCCDDYFHTIKLGNVREESLLSIWNSPRHKKLRTDVAHGVFDCAICAQCWGGKNPFY
jgi:radical SAM protein with 4Fe4S-binding SPASM domain